MFITNNEENTHVWILKCKNLAGSKKRNLLWKDKKPHFLYKIIILYLKSQINGLM